MSSAKTPKKPSRGMDVVQRMDPNADTSTTGDQQQCIYALNKINCAGTTCYLCSVKIKPINADFEKCKENEYKDKDKIFYHTDAESLQQKKQGEFSSPECEHLIPMSPDENKEIANVYLLDIIIRPLNINLINAVKNPVSAHEFAGQITQNYIDSIRDNPNTNLDANTKFINMALRCNYEWAHKICNSPCKSNKLCIKINDDGKWQINTVKIDNIINSISNHKEWLKFFYIYSRIDSKSGSIDPKDLLTSLHLKNKSPNVDIMRTNARARFEIIPKILNDARHKKIGDLIMKIHKIKQDIIKDKAEIGKHQKENIEKQKLINQEIANTKILQSILSQDDGLKLIPRTYIDTDTSDIIKTNGPGINNKQILEIIVKLLSRNDKRNIEIKKNEEKIANLKKGIKEKEDEIKKLQQPVLDEQVKQEVEKPDALHHLELQQLLYAQQQSSQDIPMQEVLQKRIREEIDEQIDAGIFEQLDKKMRVGVGGNPDKKEKKIQNTLTYIKNIFKDNNIYTKISCEFYQYLLTFDYKSNKVVPNKYDDKELEEKYFKIICFNIPGLKNKKYINFFKNDSIEFMTEKVNTFDTSFKIFSNFIKKKIGDKEVVHENFFHIVNYIYFKLLISFHYLNNIINEKEESVKVPEISSAINQPINIPMQIEVSSGGKIKKNKIVSEKKKK